MKLLYNYTFLFILMIDMSESFSWYFMKSPINFQVIAFYFYSLHFILNLDEKRIKSIINRVKTFLISKFCNISSYEIKYFCI